MFMTKLDRVATYIPEEVLKKIANVDQADAG
jgi:hypothetical protein